MGVVEGVVAGELVFCVGTVAKDHAGAFVEDSEDVLVTEAFFFIVEGTDADADRN